MTKSRTTPPNARCLTCNEPHIYDDARGWRAPDGHPYRPTTDTYPPLKSVPDARPNRAGYRGVFFGALEACESCGAVLAPEHHDLRALHANVCPGGTGDAA